MEPDHLYLIRGSSSANSAFFEREKDCKVFLKLADRFLSEYLSISSFQNNRDGWVMIIATRSAAEIRRAYKARRARSTKCRAEFEFKEIWQMLSDQIRIFLSTFVKATNRWTGRTGGKVRRRYERFVFDSEEEVFATKQLLESTYYEQSQPRKRYRPSRRLHKIRRKLLRTSVYISSRLLSIPERLRELGLSCLDLGVLADDVVRHLVATTHNHHFAP